MPAFATLLAFGVIATLVVAVPGPSNLYVVGSGISGGRRVAAAGALGCATGALVWVAATAAGLAALLASSAVAFTAVHWLGAAYLFVLALKAFRDRDEPAGDHGDVQLRLWPAYRQGALVELGNPKVALFFLALLPQFVASGHGPTWLQIVVLGVLFVVVGLCSDMAYALASGTLGVHLRRSPSLTRRAGMASGLVYLGLDSWALVGGDGRPRS
jgi:threonine/homoserine/homoserine lactone efflux protein